MDLEVGLHKGRCRHGHTTGNRRERQNLIPAYGGKKSFAAKDAKGAKKAKNYCLQTKANENHYYSKASIPIKMCRYDDILFLRFSLRLLRQKKK